MHNITFDWALLFASQHSNSTSIHPHARSFYRHAPWHFYLETCMYTRLHYLFVTLMHCIYTSYFINQKNRLIGRELMLNDSYLFSYHHSWLGVFIFILSPLSLWFRSQSYCISNTLQYNLPWGDVLKMSLLLIFLLKKSHDASSFASLLT